MEIRVLEYFLAVAREQSITAAADSLNLTQPTLSRQLKDLEDELGKTLFIRGNRHITLTEDGMLLRKRAEEITELVKKTEFELSSDNSVSGDVYIGAGETDAMRIIAKTAHSIQSEYPDVHFHIVSGDSVDIREKLDKGLIDFCVIIGNADLTKYNVLELPAKDRLGILMRRDSPLAEKKYVSRKDMENIPLIVSRQVLNNENTARLWGIDPEKHNIAATYNLIYNASLMVDEGLGYAPALDKLINTSGISNLCFRPFEPETYININLVWKKYQVFSSASKMFLEHISEYINSYALKA